MLLVGWEGPRIEEDGRIRGFTPTDRTRMSVSPREVGRSLCQRIGSLDDGSRKVVRLVALEDLLQGLLVEVPGIDLPVLRCTSLFWPRSILSRDTKLDREIPTPGLIVPNHRYAFTGRR